MPTRSRTRTRTRYPGAPLPLKVSARVPVSPSETSKTDAEKRKVPVRSMFAPRPSGAGGKLRTTPTHFFFFSSSSGGFLSQSRTLTQRRAPGLGLSGFSSEERETVHQAAADVTAVLDRVCVCNLFYLCINLIVFTCFIKFYFTLFFYY